MTGLELKTYRALTLKNCPLGKHGPSMKIAVRMRFLRSFRTQYISRDVRAPENLNPQSAGLTVLSIFLRSFLSRKRTLT